MNPLAIPVSLLTIGNVALVVVTWLLIHTTVKESRKHERETALLDDKKQERLTHVIGDAFERSQNNEQITNDRLADIVENTPQVRRPSMVIHNTPSAKLPTHE